MNVYIEANPCLALICPYVGMYHFCSAPCEGPGAVHQVDERASPRLVGKLEASRNDRGDGSLNQEIGEESKRKLDASILPALTTMTMAK